MRPHTEFQISPRPDASELLPSRYTTGSHTNGTVAISAREPVHIVMYTPQRFVTGRVLIHREPAAAMATATTATITVLERVRRRVATAMTTHMVPDVRQTTPSAS